MCYALTGQKNLDKRLQNDVYLNFLLVIRKNVSNNDENFYGFMFGMATKKSHAQNAANSDRKSSLAKKEVITRGLKGIVSRDWGGLLTDCFCG
jgi:hypothetical protein